MIDNLPVVSVVVPVYGEPDYLPQCIESILEQSFVNFELILVDDGSPDDCPMICDQYQAKDNRVKTIHKENGGLVSARKTGIEAARGKYITYVDGDDWIEPDTLEIMVHDIEKYNVEVVVYGYLKDIQGSSFEYRNHIKSGIYDKEKIKNEIIPNMMFAEDACQCGLFTYVWNKLFKRECVYNNQISVDERIIIGEDSAVVYPTLMQASSIYVSDICKYHYRQRLDSLLHKVNASAEKVKKLKIFYDYMSNWNANYSKIDIQKQIDRFYLTQLVMMSDSLVTFTDKLDTNFPFNEISIEDKVILYSAGAFGIHLYHQLVEYGYQIISWVDPDYLDFVDTEYDVESIDEAIIKNYSYIIIASLDCKYVNRTVSELMSKNVEAEKILTIPERFDELHQICKSIGLFSSK